MTASSPTSIAEAAEVGTLLVSVTCLCDLGSRRIIWILLLAAAQSILKNVMAAWHLWDNGEGLPRISRLGR